MTEWALIQNGVVRETTGVDPAGRYHASQVWVPCPPRTPYGMLFDGKAFAPAPIPVASLSHQARGLIAEIEREAIGWFLLGKPVSAAFSAYYEALRAIADGATTQADLPAPPATIP